MKITGHVGVYRIKETHFYLDLEMPKGEIICCGIVGAYRVRGHIWKGWHFDRTKVSDFDYNQKYLDWTKLERI